MHTRTIKHDTKSSQVGEHVHVHTCIMQLLYYYMYVWLTVRSMIKGIELIAGTDRCTLYNEAPQYNTT